MMQIAPIKSGLNVMLGFLVRIRNNKDAASISAIIGRLDEEIEPAEMLYRVI